MLFVLVLKWPRKEELGSKQSEQRPGETCETGFGGEGAGYQEGTTRGGEFWGKSAEVNRMETDLNAVLVFILRGWGGTARGFSVVKWAWEEAEGHEVMKVLAVQR